MVSTVSTSSGSSSSRYRVRQRDGGVDGEGGGGSPDNRPAVREVWANSDVDGALDALAAALRLGGSAGVLALDVEFPGFVRETSQFAQLQERYEAVRDNLTLLKPIQAGMAVADAHGSLLGAWSFNLRFDVAFDYHLERSVAFLENAGVDFRRHAVEGLDMLQLGQCLAEILRNINSGPRLVTFSGLHDLGYLLKMLSGSESIPLRIADFEAALDAFFPEREDLQEHLPPFGSLEHWSREFGVLRDGLAHTAGSDALLTLRLYLHVAEAVGAWSPNPATSALAASAQASAWGTAARLAALEACQGFRVSAFSDDALPAALWGVVARRAAEEAAAQSGARARAAAAARATGAVPPSLAEEIWVPPMRNRSRLEEEARRSDSALRSKTAKGSILQRKLPI
eukprot:TRINITY_DN33718_c0_g1_i1.p1 TRINITY_DN33718_c0_g1~~TRINITY_DN33718_c0_g1_i1.p1  ORF type:complete len:411 (+),score=71.89 TRINITY_DN33718_c0_g1_i1:41-1234(+)